MAKLGSHRHLAFESIIAGATVCFIMLIFQHYMQNVHITTTNGLWKSMRVSEFIQAPSWQLLDPPNALFYPLEAFIGRIYNKLNIARGLAWRQMAITNAIFAGFTAAFAYGFVMTWFKDRTVAVLTTAAYFLSGYVMLHGIINEDIMPGFSFIFIATVLACVWFPFPTMSRILSVATIFSIGWLLEWRLMFPSLPPFLLALFIARGNLLQMLIRPTIFVIGMLLPPALFAISGLFFGLTSIASAWNFFKVLIWTGKGVGSGWGGFSWNKVWLEWSSISESIFTARHIIDPSWISGPERYSVFWGSLLFLILTFSSLVYLYKNRNDTTVKNSAVILGGLFVCGAIFNMYSQPQDPQMQINVMIWAFFGWAILIHAALNFPRPAKVDRRLAFLVPTFLVAIPVCSMWATQVKYAGTDAIMAGYASRILNRFPMDEHIIVMHDFDGLMTWLAVNLQENAVPVVDNLQQAPSRDPRLKLIFLVRDVIERPNADPQLHPESIASDIEKALGLGYKVVTPSLWGQSEDNWIQAYATVAGKEKALAIRGGLYSRFEAVPVYTDPYSGTWYEIQKRK